MFEKNKMIQTYTNKTTTSMICPTCKIPMLQCQYYGGGFIGCVVDVIVQLSEQIIKE